MLTQEERDREKAAVERESNGHYRRAAADWELLGKDYRAKGKPPKGECCYLCEAARAYTCAARDYSEAAKQAPKNQQAGLNDQADAALREAAKLFLECGDFCFEAAEFACASAGYAQAEAHYRRLEKKAKAAGNKREAEDAKKKADHAEKGTSLVDKVLELRQKEESHDLKAKVQKSLKSKGKKHAAIGPQLSPRVWVGFGFDAAKDKVTVRSTMANSPAARSGLRAGDVITHVGSVAIESASEFRYLLAGLPLWERTVLSIRRRGKRLSVRIHSALNMFPKADLPGKAIDDRRCDDDCACKRPRKNAACATSFVYKGEGPNGGVMLLIRCVAMTKNFKILDECECGPYEFV